MQEAQQKAVAGEVIKELGSKPFNEQSQEQQVAFLKSINDQTEESQVTRMALMDQLPTESKVLLFNAFLREDEYDNLLPESFLALDAPNAAGSLVDLELHSRNPELAPEARTAIAQIRGHLTSVAADSSKKADILAEIQKMPTSAEFQQLAANPAVAQAVTEVINQ